jgi:ferredoxin
VDINAELAKKWSPITKRKDPLPDHEKWTNVPNKLEHLDRS